MKTKITRALVTALLEEAPEDRLVFDTEVPGFALRVRSKSASFVLRRGQNGRKRIFHIGTVAEYRPEEARDIARRLRQAIKEGRDPYAEREAARGIPTMQEFSVRYMKEYAVMKKPGSQKNDEGLWRLHLLPYIGKLRVSDINAEHVTAIKTRLKDQWSIANQAMALLSKSMNLAEMWKLRSQNSNPCKFVRKYKSKKRERILDPGEIARLGIALDRHESDCPEACRLFRVLLFTGARLNEIAKARLEWYNAFLGTIALPESKSGQKVVHVPAEAAKLLDFDRKGSLWLIPGPIKGHPIRQPRGAWVRICETAGLTGLRIHDLRHVFGSYSHHYGASQKTVALLLGHTQLSTAERYLHAMRSETKDAANKTANGIAALLRSRA